MRACKIQRVGEGKNNGWWIFLLLNSSFIISRMPVSPLLPLVLIFMATNSPLLVSCGPMILDPDAKASGGFTEFDELGIQPMINSLLDTALLFRNVNVRDSGGGGCRGACYRNSSPFSPVLSRIVIPFCLQWLLHPCQPLRLQVLCWFAHRHKLSLFYRTKRVLTNVTAVHEGRVIDIQLCGVTVRRKTWGVRWPIPSHP